MADQALELKMKEFKLALLRLEEILRIRKSKINRDSAITRFAFSYELAWKTSKEFLRRFYDLEVASPRECFKELRRQGILTDQETETALAMIADRNLAAHTYNQKFADELYDSIKKKYFVWLNNLSHKIHSAVNAK
ncbi:MAG: HI0074 family nucleotidyltransferase substrate-binding subunit [Patescibacteria group bacterium]